MNATKRLFWFAVVICPGLFSAESTELAGLLKREFWQAGKTEFEASEGARYFRWNSAKKEVAWYSASRRKLPLEMLRQKVWEGSIYFVGDSVEKVEVFFYNRAASGTMNNLEEFRALLEKLDKKIGVWMNVDGKKIGTRYLAGSRVKVKRRRWANKHYKAILSWSSSGRTKREFSAEFIKLEVFAESAQASSSPGKAEKRKGTIQVEKGGKEVVLSGIPMVDQGDRGYCAVAVAERILRAYGVNASQHLIAQLAASSPDAGTSTSYMFAMLKKTGSRFKIRVVVEYDAENFADLSLLTKKYNQVARKRKGQQVEINDFVTRDGQNRTFDSQGLIATMNPDILLETKVDKFSRGLKDFSKTIKKSIDSGNPLAWSVLLGIYPEKEILPQTAGGHLRIISGYTKDMRQVIFTDTWGTGHEKKYMDLEKAWAITRGLCRISRR